MSLMSCLQCDQSVKEYLPLAFDIIRKQVVSTLTKCHISMMILCMSMLPLHNICDYCITPIRMLVRPVKIWDFAQILLF